MKILSTKGSKVGVAGLALGLAMALGLSALAWACTVQPRIFGVSLQAPPGAEVPIEGAWMPPLSPILIRWNSPSGQMVGQAQSDANGTFSATVTIPKSAAGVYYLVASPGQPGPVQIPHNEPYSAGAGIARTPVEVVGAGDSQSGGPATLLGSADLWSGFEESATELNANPAEGSQSQGPTAAAGLALLALGGVLAGSVPAATTLSRWRARRRTY